MSVDVIREPAVAGRFYPSDPARLDQVVTELLRHGVLRRRDKMAGSAIESASGTGPGARAVTAVAPHAGYVYSGSIAAETYAGLAVPERVIVLCPNHTGLGRRLSLWDGGAWRIGDALVPIDEELSQAILAETRVDGDRAAHLREHAIEVHLPLLLKCQPRLRITPICLAGLAYAECEELATGIARALRNVGAGRGTGQDVLVVASTDMSHYVSAALADELDHLALERLLRLDARGLYETVRERQISMCGYIPTTVSLLLAREQGAQDAELVRYGNSGEASGDFERVVGYAGALIHG